MLLISALSLSQCAAALTSLLLCMQSPSKAEMQAALFNSTAVHASFGDVELAQISLRGGMQLQPVMSHLPYLATV
jgi:hypothetical protein